jgi:hypothetical protein
MRCVCCILRLLTTECELCACVRVLPQRLMIQAPLPLLLIRKSALQQQASAVRGQQTQKPQPQPLHQPSQTPSLMTRRMTSGDTTTTRRRRLLVSMCENGATTTTMTMTMTQVSWCGCLQTRRRQGDQEQAGMLLGRGVL